MYRSCIALCFLCACPSEIDILGPDVFVAVPNSQPLDPTARTDRFVQTTPPEVDVLFVLDDSGSMAQEQAALTENFPLFFQWFEGSGVDYHLGLVSTDMDSPELGGRLVSAGGYRWIDEATVDPGGVFASMAGLGTGGSGDEKGRAAAYTALELRKDAYNAGFRREGAALHVVVVSDEEDHSAGDPIALGEFVGWLLTQQAPDTPVTFSSIVTPPGVFGPGSEEPGTEYLAVTAAVGGVVWDIRSEDWSTVLDQLGIQALGLRISFPLAQLPVQSTIEVLLIHEGVTRDLEEGLDWSYDETRNSVDLIGLVPEPGAEVLITYTVLAAQDG